jgi:hypothetical protein
MSTGLDFEGAVSKPRDALWPQLIYDHPNDNFGAAEVFGVDLWPATMSRRLASSDMFFQGLLPVPGPPTDP